MAAWYADGVREHAGEHPSSDGTRAWERPTLALTLQSFEHGQPLWFDCVDAEARLYCARGALRRVARRVDRSTSPASRRACG